jgi:hypothetical protein
VDEVLATWAAQAAGQTAGHNSISAAPWEFAGMAEAAARLDVPAPTPPPAAVGEEERTCRGVFMEFMTKYFILFARPESVSFWD